MSFGGQKARPQFPARTLSKRRAQPFLCGNGLSRHAAHCESEFSIFCFEALYSLSLISPCL